MTITVSTAQARFSPLSVFLSCLFENILSEGQDEKVSSLACRLQNRLLVPGDQQPPAPGRIGACHALKDAKSSVPPSLTSLSDAFFALEPFLTWTPRPKVGPNAASNWANGHANATMVGVDGLEKRSDAIIGVSLLERNVRYPDHHHPPEEAYLLLTSGCFKNEQTSWNEIRAGQTFYNRPHTMHAMASGVHPLIAFWLLDPNTSAF